MLNLKFFQKLEKFISYPIQLTGFAGTSQLNLPLPVYLAGEKDWEAKRHSFSLPIFASCGASPQGANKYSFI